MGYRSEVAYRIVFSNKQVLNEFIALAMMKGEHEKYIRAANYLSPKERRAFKGYVTIATSGLATFRSEKKPKGETDPNFVSGEF